MKYSVYVSILFIIAVAGCQERQKESKGTINKQADTVKTESKQTSATTASNQVRSEAPDASTKTEQGYALPKFDEGIAQSPINILSSKTEKDLKHNIKIEFKDEINGVENLGHTIQLDFTEGSSVLIDGRSYKFKQVHFHTPSEHLIDGMTFPMEMHIVNESKDQKDSTANDYIVVAVLFKMGKENKFIKEFLDVVPAEEHQKNNIQPGTVKLRDLFTGIPKNELKPYYHYKGSLTTPPYSESVRWVIKKYIFEVSPEQLVAIEKIEGNNARHVQALYRRKVTSN